jgi:hypothetical protein
MESPDQSDLIFALAEIRRNQVVHAMFVDETKGVYTPAYAYALAHSICPIVEELPDGVENAMSPGSPFRAAYLIPAALVQELAQLLDEAHRGDGITFYEVEDHYGRNTQGKALWRGPELRMSIYRCCRYFYLSGWFDDDFWQHFESDSPSQGKKITGDFDLSELKHLTF